MHWFHAWFRRVTTTLACAAATVLVAASDGSAQSPPGLGPTEHQLGYFLANAIVRGHSVQLSDQFSPPLATFSIQGPFWLSTPTMKNSEPLLDDVTHYTWWDITFGPTSPPRQIIYDNQFGEHPLDVLDARYLLVPALKNPVPGQQLRPDVNHYKCYIASGQPLNVSVALHDQFGTGVYQLGAPFLFCNPALKIFEGTFPIAYPQDHLVCYELTPRPVVNQQVLYLDQFSTFHEPEPGFLTDGWWLCVPTLKVEVTPTVPETWGGLKSMYR